MSDRPDTPFDDETPEIAEVRRLLADARHVDPMPEDVAARMSRVLDRLGDEAPAARPDSPTTNVIAIAPHRRRRAAALLAAAAAIVVGGVVIQNVHLPSQGGGSDATAADANAPEAQTQDDKGMSGSRSPTSPTPPTSSQDVQGLTRVKIHPRRFTDDVKRARQNLGKATYATGQDIERVAACTNIPPDARALPATYRRADAALVFRRPRGGSQVVELFVCGSSDPIRSTTLSVP